MTEKISMAEDKRIGERLPFRMRVDYSTVDEFVIDYTENISRGGAFIRTRRPFSPGTKLQVELNVTGVPVLMKMNGKVAWVNPPSGDKHRPDLPTGMGVNFVFPDDNTRTMIEALVDKLEEIPKEKRKSVSADFLAELIGNLRPDIKKLIESKRGRSPEMAIHVERALNKIGAEEKK